MGTSLSGRPMPHIQCRRSSRWPNPGAISAPTATGRATPATTVPSLHAAARGDHVAHDLKALEVPLALPGERAGERLQHADLVLPRLTVSDRGERAEGDEEGGRREGEVTACHAEPPERSRGRDARAL